MQNHRLIFRKEAVEKYISELERSVLPRIIPPRLFGYLWILLLLLVAAGGWTWSVQIPFHAVGDAIVCWDCERWVSVPDGAPCVMARFPAEVGTHLHAGQTLELEIAGQRKPVLVPVVAVDTGLPKPARAPSCLKWISGGGPGREQPMVVAIGRLPDGRQEPPWDMAATMRARIETGRRRLAGYLPWVGYFFDAHAPEEKRRNSNGSVNPQPLS